MLRFYEQAATPDKHSLSGHNTGQNYTYNDAAQCGYQGAGQRVAGLFHPRCHEVDTHGIEDSFRAAEHDGSDKSVVGICPKPFEDIKGQTRSRAGGEHFNKGHRHQLGRKPDMARPLAEKGRQRIQKAGGPQHAHRYHQTDKRRHNAGHRPGSFLGPFHKVIVHRTPGKQTKTDNIKDN